MSTLVTGLFGERLNDALSAAGYSKGDVPRFAKKLGVSRQIVSRWLREKSPALSATNLVNAAKILSVRPHWLATGEGPMLRYHASKYSEKDMLNAFRQMTERERVLLRDLAGLILRFSRED